MTDIKEMWCNNCGAKDFIYLRRDMDLFLDFYYCKQCKRTLQVSLYEVGIDFGGLL